VLQDDWRGKQASATADGVEHGLQAAPARRLLAQTPRDEPTPPGIKPRATICFFAAGCGAKRFEVEQAGAREG